MKRKFKFAADAKGTCAERSKNMSKNIFFASAVYNMQNNFRYFEQRCIPNSNLHIQQYNTINDAHCK